MAAPAVRASFRTALAAAFPAVLVVDTIARKVNAEALPALWMALDFDDSNEFRASFGSAPTLWRDRGNAYVTVLGLSGAGDSAVAAQAEAVRVAFRNWQDASIGLRIDSATLQSAVNEDSDGQWFFLTLALSYERNFYA